ncbi:hypothetical protein [Burkholderia pyrrocinia]|uniref:hypothetical protein n=1 Tax=Burkholderia pyrrocinia TaxID=60550 RepID=UPI00201B8FD2|nr:hypothetical protein [Burkholderia pyrrocinia]
MLFEDGYYEETVDRFFVSEDGKKFVVLGKKYHYIFDMPEYLGAVLASSYRRSIKASLYDFVAQGGKISGKFRLELRRTDMTDVDRDRALADGVTKDGRDDLKMKGALDGSRYLADGFAQGKTWSSFTHYPFVHDSGDRPHHDFRQGRSRARDARYARGRRRDDGRGGGAVARLRGGARAVRESRARTVHQAARGPA